MFWKSESFLISNKKGLTTQLPFLENGKVLYDLSVLTYSLYLRCIAKLLHSANSNSDKKLQWTSNLISISWLFCPPVAD